MDFFKTHHSWRQVHLKVGFEEFQRAGIDHSISIFTDLSVFFAAGLYRLQQFMPQVHPPTSEDRIHLTLLEVD